MTTPAQAITEALADRINRAYTSPFNPEAFDALIQLRIAIGPHLAALTPPPVDADAAAKAMDAMHYKPFSKCGADEQQSRRKKANKIAAAGYPQLVAERAEWKGKFEASQTLLRHMEQHFERVVETGAQFQKDRDAALAQVANLEQLNKAACDTWADTHTRVEAIAKEAGVTVDQQGDNFVCEIAIAEAMAARIKELEAQLAKSKADQITIELMKIEKDARDEQKATQPPILEGWQQDGDWLTRQGDGCWIVPEGAEMSPMNRENWQLSSNIGDTSGSWCRYRIPAPQPATAPQQPVTDAGGRSPGQEAFEAAQRVEYGRTGTAQWFNRMPNIKAGFEAGAAAVMESFGPKPTPRVEEVVAYYKDVFSRSGESWNRIAEEYIKFIAGTSDSATRAELAKLKEEIKQLEGALEMGQENCNAEYERLREERNEARAELAKLKAESQRVNELSKTILDNSDQLREARREVERLREANRGLGDGLTQVANASDAHEQNYEAALKRIDEVTKERDAARTELAEAQKQNKHWESLWSVNLEAIGAIVGALGLDDEADPHAMLSAIGELKRERDQARQQLQAFNECSVKDKDDAVKHVSKLLREVAQHETAYADLAKKYDDACKLAAAQPPAPALVPATLERIRQHGTATVRYRDGSVPDHVGEFSNPYNGRVLFSLDGDAARYHYPDGCMLANANCNADLFMEQQKNTRTLWMAVASVQCETNFCRFYRCTNLFENQQDAESNARDFGFKTSQLMSIELPLEDASK